MRVTEIFTLGYGGNNDHHDRDDQYRHHQDGDRRYRGGWYRYWDYRHDCWRWRRW